MTPDPRAVDEDVNFSFACISSINFFLCERSLRSQTYVCAFWKRSHITVNENERTAFLVEKLRKFASKSACRAGDENQFPVMINPISTGLTESLNRFVQSEYCGSQPISVFIFSCEQGLSIFICEGRRMPGLRFNSIKQGNKTIGKLQSKWRKRKDARGFPKMFDDGAGEFDHACVMR